MSIYKLKLWFLGLFNCIWMFQGSMSRPTSKHDVLDPQNEVLKPRKSDCPVSPTSNGHNLLNISPN